MSALRAERDREGAAEALLERRDAGIREGPGILVEAVVLHAAGFAAELDDVVAVEVRRRVAHRERRHLAAARESARPAEVSVPARKS